jgi:type III restriction enzyme
MANPFFEHPILNSPYQCPERHWELDADGQPTQKIIDARRRAEFITPIPKPKKRKAAAAQQDIVFDEGAGLSTQKQQYDPNSVINEVRGHVAQWRAWPNASEWQVTPETARLLQHWRCHPFAGIRPFFCQVEAVETAIWLTEVAPRSGETRKYRPDFIVLIDDGRGSDDLLRLVVEIKGYRREDAKEKKSTMETYWVPGVNHLGTYGRWAFAEFTDAFQIESGFADRIESEFTKMIDSLTVQPA